MRPVAPAPWRSHRWTRRTTRPVTWAHAGSSNPLPRRRRKPSKFVIASAEGAWRSPWLEIASAPLGPRNDRFKGLAEAAQKWRAAIPVSNLAVRCRRCRRSELVSAARGTSAGSRVVDRSEEHTSELQSHSDLVCRLLLEKKKT